MKLPVWMSGLAIGVVLAGCGGDDGSTDDGSGGKQPAIQGSVNEASARSDTSQAIGGAKVAVGGDGLTAAQQLSALGVSGLSLVGPGAASGTKSTSDTGEARQAMQTGVCDCSETSCTFQGCGDDADPTGFTIDGTISWAGGNVVADLKYKGDTQGAAYDFHVTMNVAYTDTNVDGTVTSEGSVTTAAYTTSWQSNIAMHDVTFDGSSCPTGGTIDVTASVDGPSTADYSDSATISFDGSGC